VGQLRSMKGWLAINTQRCIFLLTKISLTCGLACIVLISPEQNRSPAPFYGDSGAAYCLMKAHFSQCEQCEPQIVRMMLTTRSRNCVDYRLHYVVLKVRDVNLNVFRKSFKQELGGEMRLNLWCREGAVIGVRSLRHTAN
jgi:hypothetical protein